MSRLTLSIVAVAAALCGVPAMAATSPFADACVSRPGLAESFGAPNISARWTTITRPAAPNANRELQVYQPSTVTTGPQGLVIVARQQARGYVSGRIASKAVYRYGCFDIVAQMPAGRGLWPAVWLRTPLGQPIDGEIDIMEGFGSHPGVFQSTLHRWASGVHHGFTCTRIGDLRSSLFGLTRVCGWQPRWWAADFTTAPHHYGLIWSPHSVIWLIDGEPYYTLHDDVPDRAMAIQLNLAIGGIFDGNPDGTTKFPATMKVRSVTWWPLRP